MVAMQIAIMETAIAKASTTNESSRVSPGDPCGPSGPCSPCTPCRPVSPFWPGGPWGPVMSITVNVALAQFPDSSTALTV